MWCEQYAQQREQVRLSMTANLYGSATPARLNIEKQILTRHVASTHRGLHATPSWQVAQTSLSLIM